MGYGSDQHIDATNAVGDEFAAEKITREEAAERLRRLGYDRAEIDDLLDAAIH